MTNRRIFARWCAAVTALVTLTACMQGVLGVGAQKGRVAIAVKWPAKTAAKAGFSVLAIPEETAKIEVAILSPDGSTIHLPEPLRPGQNSDTSFEYADVPIGPKVVQATAYDARNVAIASGESLPFNVEANKLVEARVVLSQAGFPIAGKSPSPRPDPSATPSVAPSPAPADLIFTVAGGAQSGAFDSGDPLTARFRYPQALAYDAAGDAIYVADTAYRLVRRFDLKSRMVYTVAGTTPSTGEASPAPSSGPAALGSGLGTPGGLAVGPDGSVYMSDVDNHVIRKLGGGGAVFTYAGNHRPGLTNALRAQDASFNRPMGLAAAKDGTLYVADALNHVVRRIAPNGHVTTLAGTGTPGDAGDAGLALKAQLNTPVALALDSAGETLYVAEARGMRVRRVHLPSGLINTAAGTGRSGSEGEGGAAHAADIALPLALAFDGEGRLLIADGWNLGLGIDVIGTTSRVLRLSADGRLERLAGQRAKAVGFSGDGGDARAAELNNPAGLCVDAQGQIYLADSYNNRLRMVQPAPKPTPSPSPSPSPRPEPGARRLAQPQPLGDGVSSGLDVASLLAHGGVTNEAPGAFDGFGGHVVYLLGPIGPAHSTKAAPCSKRLSRFSR